MNKEAQEISINIFQQPEVLVVLRVPDWDIENNVKFRHILGGATVSTLAFKENSDRSGEPMRTLNYSVKRVGVMVS